jgi:hypothetical protein
MQFFRASFQTPAGQQSDESENVITVQVADKNVPESVGFHAVLKNLHLRSFSAVDQEKLVVHLQYLRRVMPSVKGPACSVAEYCKEHLVQLIF